MALRVKGEREKRGLGWLRTIGGIVGPRPPPAYCRGSDPPRGRTEDPAHPLRGVRLGARESPCGSRRWVVGAAPSCGREGLWLVRLANIEVGRCPDGHLAHGVLGPIATTEAMGPR